MEEPGRGRCCYCLSSRYLINMWSCFKLVLALLLALSLSEPLYSLVANYVETYRNQIIILALFLTVIIMDVLLHLTFIIKYKKFQKNIKLLKVFYFSSFVIWMLMATLGAACSAILINPYAFYPTIMIFSLVLIYVNLLTQTYMLILVWREIHKLNIEHFRFVEDTSDEQVKGIENCNI